MFLVWNVGGVLGMIPELALDSHWATEVQERSACVGLHIVMSAINAFQER